MLASPTAPEGRIALARAKSQVETGKKSGFNLLLLRMHRTHRPEAAAQDRRTVPPAEFSTGTIVEWGYKGQRTSDETKNISVTDLRWVMQYVGRIGDAQIRAGLQASGATPAEVSSFASAIRARINQMRSAARPSARRIVSPRTRHEKK